MADGSVELPEAVRQFWIRSDHLPGEARWDYSDLAGGGLSTDIAVRGNNRRQRRTRALQEVLADDEFVQVIFSEACSSAAAN